MYAPHGWVSSCCPGTENIRVRLEDGPGKCAGRVEIQHEDGWKRVYKKGWTENNSNTVCKELKCGSYRKTATDEKFSQGSGGFLPKKVHCKGTESKISSCITEESANIDRKEEEAVGITCESECWCFALYVIIHVLYMLPVTVETCLKALNWSCTFVFEIKEESARKASQQNL